MKIRRPTHLFGDKVELMMTPMIDVVFQLLIFFTLTFKITAPEGDFNVKMPLSAPSAGVPDDQSLPPIKVRLRAASDGRLAQIGFGERSLGTDFRALRTQIRQMIGDTGGPGALASTEVEFDCDYDLRYEYVVEAITAVSGYLDPQTGQIYKLVEKVKFSPPRPPQ